MNRKFFRILELIGKFQKKEECFMSLFTIIHNIYICKEGFAFYKGFFLFVEKEF